MAASKFCEMTPLNMSRGIFKLLNVVVVAVRAPMYLSSSNWSTEPVDDRTESVPVVAERTDCAEDSEASEDLFAKRRDFSAPSPAEA